METIDGIWRRYICVIDELKDLKEDNERLREIIGSWRRKAQDKAPRRQQVIREGYSPGLHYQVFVVPDIPGDLSIEGALKEVKHSFMPEVKPFTFSRLDYSVRHKAWIVEVTRPFYYRMEGEK